MKLTTLTILCGSAGTVLFASASSVAAEKAFVAQITSVERDEGGYIRRVSNKVPSGEEIGLEATLEANDHLYIMKAKITYLQCGTIEIRQEARESEMDWLLPRTCDPSDENILPDTPGTAKAAFTPKGNPVTVLAFLKNIVGVQVYDPQNENLGEINNILLSTDQVPAAAIVELGGFLGIGQKDVAVPFDRLELAKEGKGPLKVYVQASQEELNALSDFTIETYPGHKTLLSAP